MEKMQEAARELTEKVIVAQGNGDYEGVKAWVASESVIKPQLQADLDRLSEAGIPVDIYFEMGPHMVGLE